MSISLQTTSNKCFSFLCVTVEKSPTYGNLKYRIPVVFSPIVEVLFWVGLEENLFSYPLMIFSMRWLGKELRWRVIDSCRRSFSHPVAVLLILKNSFNQCVNETNLVLETSKAKEICKKPSVSASCDILKWYKKPPSYPPKHQGKFPIRLSFKSKPNVRMSRVEKTS